MFQKKPPLRSSFQPPPLLPVVAGLSVSLSLPPALTNGGAFLWSSRLVGAGALFQIFVYVLCLLQHVANQKLCPPLLVLAEGSTHITNLSYASLSILLR